jgi:hypothetical protein
MVAARLRLPCYATPERTKWHFVPSLVEKMGSRGQRTRRLTQVPALEIVMPDLESDFRKLATDARQMAEENARLRKINSQMISASTGSSGDCRFRLDERSRGEGPRCARRSRARLIQTICQCNTVCRCNSVSSGEQRAQPLELSLTPTHGATKTAAITARCGDRARYLAGDGAAPRDRRVVRSHQCADGELDMGQKSPSEYGRGTEVMTFVK